MGEFFAQLKQYLFAPLRIFSVLVATILLGTTGPFGTFMSMGFWQRLTYWGAVVLISFFLVQVIKVLVNIGYQSTNIWKKGLLVSAIFTIILAPALNFATDTTLGRTSAYDSPLWVFAALTFSLPLLVVFVQHFLGIRTFKDRPRLYTRFSDPEADQILWMTVRDHYVDVYTDRGIETLLMRFSDALAELEGEAGLQVHRSHWVANRAVSELKNEKGRYVLKLRNGTIVPVARGYVKAASAVFS